METYSSILARVIPWTEEPGGLQAMGLHRVRQRLATKHSTAHLLLGKVKSGLMFPDAVWFSISSKFGSYYFGITRH